MTANFRVGLAGGHTDVIEKRMLAERATCNLAAGDLYLFPNSSSTIDATQPITFTWNTACAITTPTVDLYLYEPSSATGLIHAWTGVNFADGKYTATLLPKWWNDTTTATLQLSIIDGGGMSWMTTSPAGPPFAITYSASAMFATTSANGGVATSTNAAAATQSVDAVFQNVSSTKKSSGISKGAIAAAVIVPILVLAVIAAVAVRFYRMKEAEKRKRWSKAISSHSNLDWREGALASEKPASIYGRPSFGSQATGNRTSSMFAAENNYAGAGAGLARPPYNGRSHSASDVNAGNDMHSIRSSLAMGANGEMRQSRISFAEAARPDRRSRLSLGEGLRPEGKPSVFRLPGASKSAAELATPSRKSAAYATGSALDDEDDINISPSQMQGPNAFAEAEMKRVGNGRRTGRKSILSLGGDKRRDSSASALSTDDFRSAASARGSVDELRGLEAVMLMRRSRMSQNSGQSPHLPDSPHFDNNQVEALQIDIPSPSKPPTPLMPAPPTPVLGSATVAYGPDHMLAVYAARAKANQGGVSVVPTLGPVTTPKPSAHAGMSMPPPPVPVTMRSYVHLNNGTVSAETVGNLPPPMPEAAGAGQRTTLGLRIPSFTATKRGNAGISTTSNAASDGSRYSGGEFEEAHAK